MGYISTKQGEGFIVSATKGIWVYWAIAVPLVTITMGAYYLYEWLCRRARLSKEIPNEHFIGDMA